jgi:hypothetical protein
MRQLAAALLALALLPTIAHGQTVTPTFADIPWGAGGTDVVKAATAAGFRLVAQDHDGDYQLEGEWCGAPAVVYAYMSPTSGLVKVQVRLSAPGDQARSQYARVVQTLASQYGSTEGVEIYRLPYQKGDGREDEAVRVGKGLLYSMWGDDLQPGEAALVVRATKLVVGLDYESHAWSAESDRRKSRPASEL